MIVNYDKKFIFVGIPFSASSAISKELLEHYGCQTLLHKHASIPALLWAKPNFKITEYKIVVVVRDPVDASLTLYDWLKNNRNDHFTKQENFIENGGTVTRRHRKLFEKVQKRRMTFNEYLDYSFRVAPYDSLLSENSKFVTNVIRYEKLQNDFKDCFTSLGLNIDRELPIYNQTKDKINDYTIDQKRLRNYFSSFLKYNHKLYEGNYLRNGTHDYSYLNYFKFMLFRFLKSNYRLYLDLKLMGRKISHID